MEKAEDWDLLVALRMQTARADKAEVERDAAIRECVRYQQERDAIAKRFENALSEGAKRREERDAAQAHSRDMVQGEIHLNVVEQRNKAQRERDAAIARAEKAKDHIEQLAKQLQEAQIALRDCQKKIEEMVG